MNNYSIISAQEMISRFFENFDKTGFERSNKILNAWDKTLSKIKRSQNLDKEKNIDYGEFLKAHTELIDLKDGVLIVEADHSSWLQLLQIYSKFLLNGLQKEAPELEIKMLSFRLKTKS